LVKLKQFNNFNKLDGYLFVNEPTKIADVKVIKATSSSATIAWTTNHPANGKLNYGFRT